MAPANISPSLLATAGKSCAVKVLAAATLAIVVLALLALGIEHRADIAEAMSLMYAAILNAVSFGGDFWGAVLTSGIGICAGAWALCASESIHDVGGKDYKLTTTERRVLVAVGVIGATIWILGALSASSIVAGIEIPTNYELLALFALCAPLVVLVFTFVYFVCG